MEKLYAIRCEECGKKFINTTGTGYCPEHGYMEVVNSFSVEEVTGIGDLHETVKMLIEEVRDLRRKVESMESNGVKEELVREIKELKRRIKSDGKKRSKEMEKTSEEKEKRYVKLDSKGYKCKICGKEFEKQMAVIGHLTHHQ